MLPAHTYAYAKLFAASMETVARETLSLTAFTVERKKRAGGARAENIKRNIIIISQSSAAQKIMVNIFINVKICYDNVNAESTTACLCRIHSSSQVYSIHAMLLLIRRHTLSTFTLIACMCWLNYS